MKENLQRLEKLKFFMGGDNEDVPIFQKAIEDMRYIIIQCNKNSLPQPEIFPWVGGIGIQAEWDYDWYLEINSDDKEVSVLFVKGQDYDNAIDCRLYDIEDAFNMVKAFIKNIVDINGNR